MAYEIATVGEFRKRALENMPSGTRLERAVLGTLKPDPKGWFASDPFYFQPDRELEDPFPFKAPAKVVADVLVAPDGRGAIAAVEVRVSDATPTDRKELEVSMAVDKHRVMIGAASRARRGWKIGGPNCRANLLDGDVTAEAERLKAAGVDLDGPLSEAKLAKARSLLRRRKVKLNVWQTETGVRLDEKMEDRVSVRLGDWAIVFRTGFGNGIFYWDALLNGKATVAWRMSFL